MTPIQNRRIGKRCFTGRLRWLTLYEGKFVGFERLFGSRRSLITQSDDGYVEEAASGFDQTKVVNDRGHGQGDTVKGTPWSLENALRVRSNHPNRWF